MNWVGGDTSPCTDRRADGQTDPPCCPLPTLGVQQFAEPQLLLGRVEGLLEVVGRVGLGQLVEVDEIRPTRGTMGRRTPPGEPRRPGRPQLPPAGAPVLVDEGVEGQAVPPAGGEVLDVHLGVAVGTSWGSPGGGTITLSVEGPSHHLQGPPHHSGGPSHHQEGPSHHPKGTSHHPEGTPRHQGAVTTHPAVFIWHQSSSASLAERVSRLSSVLILITWIWGNARGH